MIDPKCGFPTTKQVAYRLVHDFIEEVHPTTEQELADARIALIDAIVTVNDETLRSLKTP